ncbi:response regulator [Sphingobacterium sp. UBA5670]|uniref:response regulator n=1 Tax=Sphingobacterium sp. UBA5670 TaxID=1947502 RepID=UPI0025EEE2BA|nr:response regulator [Sphingobacterium sp. UBA5670]
MRRKIFICDDDKNIVEMLEMVLGEFTEATILSETDSRKAFARLAIENPDILLVDISMPIVSGDQLIRQIRDDMSISSMFIICMSANLMGEQIAINAGADVYLAKPFDMSQLLSLIGGAAQTG